MPHVGERRIDAGVASAESMQVDLHAVSTRSQLLPPHGHKTIYFQITVGKLQEISACSAKIAWKGMILGLSKAACACDWFAANPRMSGRKSPHCNDRVIVHMDSKSGGVRRIVHAEHDMTRFVGTGFALALHCTCVAQHARE